MNLEALKALGVTDVELGNKLVTAIGTHTTSEVDKITGGLKNKRDELLGKVTSFKEQKAIFDALGDPTELKKIVDAHKKGKKEEDVKAGNYEKLLEVNNNEWQAKFDAESVEKTKYKNHTEKKEIDGQLTAELMKAGVTNPSYLKAAKALLNSGIEVVEDTEGFKALKEGKTIAQHIEEWAKTDEAKHFITADENAGGGAGGNKGGGGGVGSLQQQYNDAMKNKNPREATRLKRLLQAEKSKGVMSGCLQEPKHTKISISQWPHPGLLTQEVSRILMKQTHRPRRRQRHISEVRTSTPARSCSSQLQ